MYCSINEVNILLLFSSDTRYVLMVVDDNEFDVNLDHFVDFYKLGDAFATTSRWWGLWFFMSMFRFLQYSEVVSEKMGALLLTLTQALWDLGVYVFK